MSKRKTKDPKIPTGPAILSYGIHKEDGGWVLYKVKSQVDGKAEHEKISLPDYRDFTHHALKLELVKQMSAATGPWVDGKWEK